MGIIQRSSTDVYIMSHNLFFTQRHEHWRKLSNNLSDADFEALVFEYVDAADDETKSDMEPIYCLCRRVEYGEMVACDNNDCRTEWFHFECVGLIEAPTGKWFCEECDKSKAAYKCKMCCQIFDQKPKLKAHKKSKHRKDFSDDEYPCPECENTFKSFHRLKKHIDTNVHNDKRPFTCAECGKQFKQKGHLYHHNLVHTMTKPFECAICLKRFKHTSYLKKHEQIHRPPSFSN